MLGGELDSAQRAHDQTLTNGSLANAVALRLAYLRDDDVTAERYANGPALDAAFRAGNHRHVGLLAGCIAALHQVRGRNTEAWELRRRALAQVEADDFSFWLLDQMATSPDEDDVARARAVLERSARESDPTTAAAYLALFDSRVILRQGQRDAARSLARDAAAQFDALGRPWERAQALEVAGELARALAIYERLGYARDAKRVTRARRRARHRPSTTNLTQRELEVARLAVQGLSNRAIADALFIGERTVETHITAVFERFHLSSRRELGGLLERLGISAEPEPMQPAR